MNCSECKNPCCNNVRLKYGQTFNSTEDVLQEWITRVNVEGIPLKKKKNGKWVCEWYNQLTRRCKHYSLRPLLCRSFYCLDHPKNTYRPKGYLYTNTLVLAFKKF